MAIHNEHIHFKGWPTDRPAIKVCAQTLRIRANQAWKKLSKNDQECTVAHEIAHLEYEHHLKGGLFSRVASLLQGQAPENEVEADKYACKLIGRERYLKFLKKCRDNTPRDNNYSLQLADYNHRIKALEKP